MSMNLQIDPQGIAYKGEICSITSLDYQYTFHVKFDICTYPEFEKKNRFVLGFGIILLCWLPIAPAEAPH